MPTASHLNRSLGLTFAIVLVLGNIIGSGIYKKVAPMAAELQSPGWVLLCWVFGGVISMMGALSNAEIAGMMPATGGEYAYYKKIYGRFFSFLYGWSNFAAIKTAAIASIAYVFAQSFGSMFALPQLFSQWQNAHVFGVFFPFAGFSIKLIAIAIVIFLTWVNSRGLKLGAGISMILLMLVLAGVFSIIFFGGMSAEADFMAAVSLETKTGGAVTLSAIFTAMLAAFWAYEGWNSVGFLGGEIKNPGRNLPLSISLGLALVILLYVLVNWTYLSLVPVGQMIAVNEAGNQIAAVHAVKAFWDGGGVLFISILILLSTLGCTHATIMSNARTSFAMASEGLFFRKMGKVNHKGVPGNALWYQCWWACVLVLSGTFDQLTDMLIFAAFIFYGATTLGVFILRKRMPAAPRPYKVPGYPLVPGLFILFCIFLIGNTIITRPREAAIGLILIFLGIPFYFWFLKTKSAEQIEEGIKVE